MNKNKTAIALFLMFAMAVSLVALPVINAQVEYTNMQESGSIPLPSGVTPDSIVKTEAHLSLSPNPVGVGQTVSIIMWLSPPLHESRYHSNYTVIITDPDGNREVIVKESYYADATSWLVLTPNQVGTWTIKFEFPGSYFPAGNYTVAPGAWSGAGVVSFPESIYYEPSSDGPYSLTVQEEQVSSWPTAPLPTDYWTRPVSPENREWWSITGWYPSTGVVGEEESDYWPNETNTYMSNYGYVPYVQGPNSAHIVWKQEGAIGGLVGGPLGEVSWTSGGGTPSIIYAGRCYQGLTKVVDGESSSVWQCYDLRTGEVLWEQPSTTTTVSWYGYEYTTALVPTVVTYAEGFSETPGAEAQLGRNVWLTYVGGGNLINYDPYTGTVSQNISIAPLDSGTFYANYESPYFLSVQTLGNPYYPYGGGDPPSYRLITWTIQGEVGAWLGVDWQFHIVSNVSWPWSSLSGFYGGVDYEAGIAVNVESPWNVGVGANLDANITAASLETGDVLWSIMADVPFNVWPMETIVDHGKVAIGFEDGHYYCWDLKSGKKLWKSEISTWPWGVFGAYGIGSYGGNIIIGQYDGVAAYDWDTGKVAWLYPAPAEYPYESAYNSSYPFFSGSPLIADGKVYYCNNEHTATQPITRGWKLHCINATTGEGIWNITGSMTPGAIADGYLTASNTYDGYMYVFGKGKSATTVTVPSTDVEVGQSFTITGTVLDKSPAQPDTPAISDEYMGVWMGYLHMQKPKPTDAKGVTVKLGTLDPNNNWIDIGEATTDLNGVFGFTWAPEVPGLYQIVATFEGSESYGSSTASTYLTAVEAPVATPEPTPTPAPMTDTYITGFGIAIIVAIAIVGILLFRRRP